MSAQTCCFKTPSLSSMDNRDIQETALSNNGAPEFETLEPMLPLNNNNKFHALNQEKILHRFPRKLAVDLKFTDIYYRAREWSLTRKPEMKEILHGVSGEFRAGELTAIMGPSGAGKSTLLNILAGYKIRGSEGSVLVNGTERSNQQHRSKFTRLSCYILQDDALRPKLTVIEAMTFASHLKLGFGTSRKNKHKQVMDLLEMLGLREHINTRTNSLSGGQKKRLSIALELISNPPVLFLDEPTTGLDSLSCSQCVSLLKLLAQQGRTVVCTIHQPSALLFEMFDHLYALAKGNCIYQGSIKGLLPFLSDLGFNCPTYHNPADFLMEVAIGEYDADINMMAAAAAKNVQQRRKALGYIETEKSVARMNEANKQYASLASSEDSSIDTLDDISMSVTSTPFILQFFLLYYRNLKALSRSYTGFTIRLIAHLVIGLVFGYLYRGVGSKAEGVFGNYVYLYGSALFLVYTAKMAVTVTIPMEMEMIKREYFNRWYSLLPNFLATILIEIPIQIVSTVGYVLVSYYMTDQSLDPHRVAYFYLGTILASLTAQAFGFLVGVLFPLKIAVFVGPVIAVMFSTFGFNIFYRDIPDYFLWLYHISYFRAMFHNLAISAYGLNRTHLSCNEIYCHYKVPERFLTEVDIHSEDFVGNFIYVSILGVVLHMCTVSFIWYKLNRR